MKEENKILLAALLHDIGKFWQRTDRTKKGKHSELAGDFFQEFVPKNWKQAGYIALQHHNPEDTLTPIVQSADHLSSKEREIGKGDPLKERLYPIQDSLYLPRKNQRSENNKKETDHRVPLSKLDLVEGSILPKPVKREALQSYYEKLWNEFVEEIQLLPSGAFDSYYNSLYYLLYKYTSNIPSAVWRSRPDISLFDHARTTAAIALCLLRTDLEEQFLYVEGDVPGIQNFIYQIASPQIGDVQKNMANRLRGRSFYLTLLNDTLSFSILDALSLPITNLLWSGGGHFSILAPATQDAKRNLHQQSSDINSYLLDKYEGRLSLALAQVKVSGERLQDNFPQVKKQIARELISTKRRKFRDISPSRKFELKDKVCPVCDNTFAGSDKICPECQFHVDLGKKIRNAGSLTLLEDDKEADVSFKELGFYWKIDTNSPGRFKFYINNLDFLPENSKDHTPLGFKLLANRVPSKPDFSNMAKLGDGVDYIGILRMDVDDLGPIFSLGFREEDRSISRFATLSRYLDIFFTGYLDHVCGEYESTYTTYSGGDDVFLVGAWSEMIDLALKVRDKFDEFSCGNPDLHLSASLFASKPTFPIGRSAKLAGQDLNNEAKMTEGKNSIYIFGQTIGWKDFKEVIEFSKSLVNHLDSGKISKGLAYKFQSLYDQHIEEKVEDINWIPKLLYALTRNVEDENLREELKVEVQNKSRFIPTIVSYVNLATRK